MGFEPTTPGLKVRDPSAELAAQRDQAPRAGVGDGETVDQPSPDDLPTKQAAARGRPSLRTCVVMSGREWSGRRESNPCDLR